MPPSFTSSIIDHDRIGCFRTIIIRPSCIIGSRNRVDINRLRRVTGPAELTAATEIVPPATPDVTVVELVPEPELIDHPAGNVHV